MPTPHASQGINQGFYVRRSHSGSAAGDVTDSGEDPEPPAARDALGTGSGAKGTQVTGPAALGAQQVAGWPSSPGAQHAEHALQKQL